MGLHFVVVYFIFCFMLLILSGFYFRLLAPALLWLTKHVLEFHFDLSIVFWSASLV